MLPSPTFSHFSRYFLPSLCFVAGYWVSLSPAIAQEQAHNIAIDILFPANLARAAAANCEEVELDSNAMRIYFLRSEQRFIDIGADANRWLGVRYSESDFAQHYTDFANDHGLSATSVKEDFCDAILREIEGNTVIGGLLSLRTH
jgi:hypothetical protein